MYVSCHFTYNDVLICMYTSHEHVSLMKDGASMVLDVQGC